MKSQDEISQSTPCAWSKAVNRIDGSTWELYAISFTRCLFWLWATWGSVKLLHHLYMLLLRCVEFYHQSSGRQSSHLTLTAAWQTCIYQLLLYTLVGGLVIYLTVVFIGSSGCVIAVPAAQRREPVQKLFIDKSEVWQNINLLFNCLMAVHGALPTWVGLYHFR